MLDTCKSRLTSGKYIELEGAVLIWVVVSHYGLAIWLTNGTGHFCCSTSSSLIYTSCNVCINTTQVINKIKESSDIFL
jgi:hypothetical protein